MSGENYFMRRHSPALFWLIAPFSIALWLILVTPTHWLGIETGATGTALLLLTAWAGLWLASRIPVDAESSVSPAEVRQWVALAFTAVIAAFLLFNADTILVATTIADLRGIGRTCVLLIIAWAIFSSILRQRAQSGVQEDERDRRIEWQADRWSHGVICVLVIAVAVTLGLSPPDTLGWARPIVIAHLLILALVMANVAGCVAAIVLHWRERT